MTLNEIRYTEAATWQRRYRFGLTDMEAGGEIQSLYDAAVGACRETNTLWPGCSEAESGAWFRRTPDYGLRLHPGYTPAAGRHAPSRKGC